MKSVCTEISSCSDEAKDRNVAFVEHGYRCTILAAD